MIEEKSYALTDFRHKISKLCHAINKGEKQFIVRKYCDDLFKVVAYDNKVGVKFGVAEFRQNTPDFLELLKEYGSVILTINGKSFVRCIKL